MTEPKATRANNRRSELMDAAMDAFIEHGFDGTSVADLVEAVGMSKAAFGYHFASKDALLVELASPLLTDLGALEAEATTDRRFVDEYLDVLLRHSNVVAWVDGDRTALSHPEIGHALAGHLERMRSKWGDGTEAGEVRASMALAALWRPIRNLDEEQVARARDTVSETVVAMLA
jgi:AcrR family transcriptional regulator